VISSVSIDNELAWQNQEWCGSVCVGGGRGTEHDQGNKWSFLFLGGGDAMVKSNDNKNSTLLEPSRERWSVRQTEKRVIKGKR